MLLPWNNIKSYCIGLFCKLTHDRTVLYSTVPCKQLSLAKEDKAPVGSNSFHAAVLTNLNNSHRLSLASRTSCIVLTVTKKSGEEIRDSTVRLSFQCTYSYWMTSTLCYESLHLFDKFHQFGVEIKPWRHLVDWYRSCSVHETSTVNVPHLNSMSMNLFHFSPRTTILLCSNLRSLGSDLRKKCKIESSRRKQIVVTKKRYSAFGRTVWSR